MHSYIPAILFIRFDAIIAGQPTENFLERQYSCLLKCSVIQQVPFFVFYIYK